MQFTEPVSLERDEGEGRREGGRRDEGERGREWGRRDSWNIGVCCMAILKIHIYRTAEIYMY